MIFDWNEEKNTHLKKYRFVNFEDIRTLIEPGNEYSLEDNPSSNYPHQKIIYIEISECIYAVPCLPIPGGYFLKTLYPTRKITKKLLNPNTK